MAKRHLPKFLLPFEQDLLLQQFLPAAAPGIGHRGRPPVPIVKLRDLCLVRLMLNGGLRVSEVLNLKVKDLEIGTGQVRVIGKGDKERIIWLNQADVKLVQVYLEVRPGGQAPDHFIFLNLKGARVSTRYIRRMVSGAAVEAGITGKRIHPHTLRHSFATDLLRATKNIRVVQKALGHNDLKTTQIYADIVDDEMEDAMKNFRNGRG